MGGMFQIGQPVYLDSKGHLTPATSKDAPNIVGIAARDIKKGEIIRYSPGQITEDIIANRVASYPFGFVMVNDAVPEDEVWLVSGESKVIIKGIDVT